MLLKLDLPLILLNLCDELLGDELNLLVQQVTDVLVQALLKVEEVDPRVGESCFPINFRMRLLEIGFSQQLKLLEEAFPQLVIQMESLFDFVLVKVFELRSLLYQGLYDLHLNLLEEVVFANQCFWREPEIQVAL